MLEQGGGRIINVGADSVRNGLPEHAAYNAAKGGVHPLTTGLAAITLIRAGVLKKHPALCLGFSHGGGAIVALVHRLQHGWAVSNGFDGSLPLAPRDYAAKFYYDSLVYEQDYLLHLVETFAPGQVFAGTDYPYLIEQKDLRRFLSTLPTRHHHAVFVDTARRFLGLR